MHRRLAVALGGTLLGLAGCATTAPALPPPPPRAVGAGAPHAAAPNTGCNPRASLRPTGALPAPGHMPAGTLMAQIQQRGRLVLGTSQDTLLFSSRNPFTGRVVGFDVDMGRMVASAIFGDPNKLQIKVITNADRIPQAVAGVAGGGVDLVAQTMTMNCDRWNQVDFSTEYYSAGQKVLVSTTSTVKGIKDLGGKSVCAAAGSTSLGNIRTANPAAKPVDRPTFGDCLVAFQQGEVDAISTDDVILKGLAAQDPYTKVVGDAFTAEPYGMAMSPQHPEFVRFVNAVLEQYRRSGGWASTYRQWLGDSGTVPAPPAAAYR